MYRAPYLNGFRYVCGLYYQSHGKVCKHNHVDGSTAVRFATSVIRQQVLWPNRMEKIRQRLKAMAEAELNRTETRNLELPAKRAELQLLKQKIEFAGNNLALAQSADQFKTISSVFDSLKCMETSLNSEIAAIENSASNGNGIDAELDAAMALLDSAGTLSAVAEADLAGAKALFDALNIRLFFSFRNDLWGKRKVRKISAGVLCVGNQPSPVKTYAGPTSRHAINDQIALANTIAADSSSATQTNVSFPPREEDSLGNTNRGDRIRTCDL